MGRRGPQPGKGGAPRRAPYYQYSCPTCGVAQNEPCRSYTGRVVVAGHLARRNLAGMVPPRPESPWKPNTPCIWNHTPRGGYGYTFPIAAIVVDSSGPRVKIRVFNPRTVQVEEKSVIPSRLQPAPDPLPANWPEPLRPTPELVGKTDNP